LKEGDVYQDVTVASTRQFDLFGDSNKRKGDCQMKIQRRTLLSIPVRLGLAPLLVAVALLAVAAVRATVLAQEAESRDGMGTQAVLAPLGTGFTYQGQLKLDGEPVDEICDFQFGLYDAASLGNQVGVTLTKSITVTEGFFTANLDFGAAFTGDARWLGIAVKCGGESAYTSLGRQELTAAPYALYALGAPWSGLSSVPLGFADNTDDNTTYTVGEGLEMTGTEISVDFTAVAPLSHTHTFTSADELKYFEEEALIPTNGARDWESFTIGSDHYLAVANTYNGSTYNLDSKIYRWNGTAFTETQSIPTNGAMDWEFFTIGSDYYLAVANHYNNSTYNVNSKIYRWNGTAFSEIQSIPTNGAADWEFFTIGSDHYLAVANYHNGSTHNVNSKIYQWTGTGFAEFQSIPTNGAQDWEFFTVGSDHYLVVANSHNGSTTNVNSKIYRWNGASFAEFQSIATNCAIDWESFTIGSDHYLAVANSYNMSTYNLDSKIYRWNGTSFALFQSIPTNAASGWKFFTIGNDHYLAVANLSNDFTHYVNSRIYKATLQAEGYVQLDALSAAPPAADCDEVSERGRMKVDVVNDLLYICTNSGWVFK
jgi:hypothetical protein